VDYDPAWTETFQRERVLIAGALAGLAVAIEHVGSTAVPGLAAKPIIDIMVGVEEISIGERCVEPLDEAGYEFRGDAGFRDHFFWRKGNPRLANIHMVEQDSEFWRDHIAFRDALRTAPDLAREYGVLKRRLAIAFQDNKFGYNRAKEPFILRALGVR